MSPPSGQLIFLILQFLKSLDKGKFKETIHNLERESAFYFNMNYFEEAVLAGEWEKVEGYLLGFTNVHDNLHSRKIFFEIFKQKYLETLDKKEWVEALDILRKDLKVFEAFEEETFKELTLLFTLENIRECEKLSNWNPESARAKMLSEVTRVVHANPSLRKKLQFPKLEESRLMTLIKQGFNYQHHCCQNPVQKPAIKTLFYDHYCSKPNDSLVGFSSANSQLVFKRPRSETSEMSTIRILGAVNAVPGTSYVAFRGAPAAPIVGLQSGGDRPIVDVRKLVEISEPSQCTSLTLTDNSPAIKVANLTYARSGLAIWVLSSIGVHKLWKWPEIAVSGKAIEAVVPQTWQHKRDILMNNDISDLNTKETIHCFALSNNNSYIISASGGKISIFSTVIFEKLKTFMPPPPTATFLAFHPYHNNIIAIGMDDASIQIYDVQFDELKCKLRGHQDRITGLAFSMVLNVLISSGEDAQLCVWGMDAWDKQASRFLQILPGRTSVIVAETKVQFHQDQVQFLVVQESHIAIYEAAKLECLKLLVPEAQLVTYAAYSCNSQMIYASFTDGTVRVLTVTLELRCQINSTAYLNSPTSSSIYPVVIAVHPSEPNQFALGLTDGGVTVLEPLKSVGKWEFDPQPENVQAVAPANQLKPP